MISYMIYDIFLQVDEAEKALKMKIRPRNAFLSCYKLDFLSALPREELHQFPSRATRLGRRVRR